MTGIEPDEVIDSQDWIDQQGGQESWAHHTARTFGMLGALAYGLSDKDGLRPRPGQFKKWFNRVCWGYSLLFFGPIIFFFTVTLVIVIINALGGDHNAMWHGVCNFFNAEGGWCPDAPEPPGYWQYN